MSSGAREGHQFPKLQRDRDACVPLVAESHPRAKIEARLWMSNDLADVTLHLPEMKTWGKLEMVPRVWEDAKMAEALEYQGLTATWRLGQA